MKSITQPGMSKVPEVTLGFWFIKIAATTLGETGGDALSMTMQLGYALSSAIFIGLFVVAVALYGFHIALGKTAFSPALRA